MGVAVVVTPLASFHRGTMVWSPPTERRAPPPTWRSFQAPNTTTSTQSNTRCGNDGVQLASSSSSSSFPASSSSFSSSSNASNRPSLFLLRSFPAQSDGSSHDACTDTKLTPGCSASFSSLVVPVSGDPHAAGNPPVTGGAIITNRAAPARTARPDDDDDDAQARLATRRAAQWNSWQGRTPSDCS